MGEVRCKLLTKNLSGLTVLDIGTIFSNVDGNNLSDLAVRSIVQLNRLTQLWIGTDTLIQV